MPTTYKTPGVYIKEIPTLPKSVVRVETAIPAFIGYTEKAEKKGQKLHKNKTPMPTRITSMAEYEEYFGGPKIQTFTIDIHEEQKDEFQIMEVRPDPLTFKMYYSMQLFFANGGGPCYIVSVNEKGYENKKVEEADFTNGLDALRKEDEPTLILFPDLTSLAAEGDYYQVIQSALTQCKELGDRFTLIDVYQEETNGVDTLRNSTPPDIDFLKYGAVYYPSLITSLNYEFNDDSVKIGKYEKSEDLKEDEEKAKEDTKEPVPEPDPIKKDLPISDQAIKRKRNELYHEIVSAVNKQHLILPPSSAIAGVYARIDNSRGVWKAPANVGLLAVIGPTIKIDEEAQKNLNVDPVAGKSINAIRFFTGRGTLVWGSRTLAGNDNEWRYIPVRRLFNMAEESLKKATSWVVFEPNDANTWIKVKGQTENFLVRLWRDGALAGARPEEAFFVNVGLGTTMTALDILEGRMNIEIGMAAVRPAEFIILKFSHKLQES